MAMTWPAAAPPPWRRRRGVRQKAWLLVMPLFLMSMMWHTPVTGGASDLASDARALQSFLSNLKPTARVSWPAINTSSNTSSNTTDLSLNPCTWQGVKCTSGGGNNPRVRTLRLPGLGLSGSIRPGTLGLLSELQVLSLRSNKLSGQFPPDLSVSTNLRAVYLQRNLLSGELPSLAGSSARILHLDLSFNNFSSPIPDNYTRSRFGRLTTLLLQNNSLSGALPPAFPELAAALARFNVSYNEGLEGSVPEALQAKFGASAFSGTRVCGPPLFPQCPGAPVLGPVPGPGSSPAPMKKKPRRLSEGYIIAIAVGGAIAAIAFIAACLLVLLAYTRRSRSKSRSSGKLGGQKAGQNTEVPKGGGGNGNGNGNGDSAKDDFSSAAPEMDQANKLVFFDDNRYTFDLEDLLRASAEVLGKGSVGTAYKAVLEDGATVVVKRLKDVSLPRKDFQQHMDVLGAFRHRHLLPLRAFYYSKDEKLLLFDYMPLGSLSTALHGNKGANRSSLDWDARIKIAAGVAKGIAFLHEKGGSKFTHGNIKSSNVLLSNNHNATATSDYSLAPIFGSSPTASRIVGYRAPEVLHTRKITQKSDVYSYGVLLLELLTGKAPTNTSTGEGMDLPTWVQSVVREEWTSEVFDVELMRYEDIEEELVEILQIAMACVAASPDQRPTMAQVVKMIEEVRSFEVSDDDATRKSSSDKSKDSNGTPPRVSPMESLTTPPGSH